MANDTLIQQGYFTSDGTDKVLTLRSDFDWIKVTNWNNLIAGVQWAGVTWYWQTGMTAGDAITEYHASSSQALSLSSCTTGYNSVTTYGGIYKYDSSSLGIGAAVATTAGSNATQPAITCSNAGLTTNASVVRIYHAAWPNLSGLDILVGTLTSTTAWTFAATLATAPGVAGSTGTYKVISYGPLYVPTRRVIANISAAANAVVTTLAPHGLVAGQQVRLVVPDVCSMTQANKQTANVVSVTNVYTFVVDLDTTAFTAFTFPTAAQAPCTYADVVPFGETASSSYVNKLDDAVYNQSIIGARLATSSTPAVALGSAGGTSGDLIYWQCGKVFSNN